MFKFGAFFLVALPALLWSQPNIVSLSPTSVQAGSSGLTVSVNGGVFDICSRVRVDGTDVPTELLLSTNVMATFPANVLTTPRAASITVANYPSPGCVGSPLVSTPRTFNVTPTTLVWETNANLPAGTVGVSYSQFVLGVGGVDPLKYSVVAGSNLPGGLTLSQGGTLSGVPTAPGSFSFTLAVTDSCPVGVTYCQVQTVNRTFNMTIAAGAGGPSILTSSLPPATACSQYQATLAASGGTLPYTWSATGLPQGMTISTAGILSNRPLVSGTFQVTLTVRDGLNLQASRTLPLTVNASSLSITTGSLPTGAIGSAYSASLAASGGTQPYSFAAISDVAPGINTASSGAITGTPTQSGQFNTLFRVTDSTSCTATRTIPLVVSAPALTINPTTPPQGRVGEAYAFTVTATGGTGNKTFLVSAGGLPAGLTLAPGGLISGVPTAAVTSTFTVRATDQANLSVTRQFSITIVSGLTITTASLPTGTACALYSAVMAATGGTGAVTWSATGLPAGYTINAETGLISGSSGATGAFTVSVTARDQVTQTTRTYSLVLTGSSLTFLNETLPPGFQNQAYTATLLASGGVAPYVFTSESALPPGLLLATSGVISGIPAQQGTFQIPFRVTDAGGCASSRVFSIFIQQGGLSVTTTFLPAGRTGQSYIFQLAAAGGGPIRTWSISAGNLPDGLALDPQTGLITGTPITAGDFNFVVSVSDGAANAAASVTITITTALNITTESLPPGSIGLTYRAAVTAAGGVAPFRFTATGLPPGLDLDGAGLITGVPQAAGAFPVLFQVTDAVQLTASKRITLTVGAEFRITTDLLPPGQVRTPYNQTLTATGGRPPLTWTLVEPATMPAGLTLTPTGQILGTPSTPGSFDLPVRVTDLNGAQTDKTLRLTVLPSFNITTEVLPTATTGEVYRAALESEGGSAPLRWSVESGTLPRGVTLDGSAGVIEGVPQETGPFAFVLLARDSGNQEARKSLGIFVRTPLVLAPDALPPGELGALYRQALTVTGTLRSVSVAVVGGSLPDGLAIEGLDQAISLTGTPTRAGTFNFTLRATDADGLIGSRSYSIRIASPPTIGTQTLPQAFEGAEYNFTLAAAGGSSPYAWSISNGALPPDIQLGSASGALSGTPSSAGNFDFTVSVRDADGRQATAALTLRVAPALTLGPPSLPNGTVGVPYSQQLSTDAAGGTLLFAVTGGALPAGLALNAATGLISGVPHAAGRTDFTVRVTDGRGPTGSRVFSITVAALVIPSFNIQPEAAGAAEQPAVSISLASPVPADLDGVLRVRFTAEDGGAADPAVRLSAGDGQSAIFRIPAGQTAALLPQGLALQTGTVAGTITLTLELTANGIAVTPSPAPTRTIRINRAAPVIDSVAARRSGNTITLDLVGFSTAKEVTSAEVQFTGGSLAQSTFTVQTGAVIGGWYQDARSRDFGSLFRLSVPFTITGDAALINQVTVTLINSVGRSQPKQAAVQ